MAYADPDVRRAKNREHQRQYRARLGKEEIARRAKASRDANRDHYLELERKRRAANPEAARAAVRRSYQKHADLRRAEALAYKYAVEQSCAVDGCDTRATTNTEGSMCDKHAWRLKHWGTTDDSGRRDVTGPNAYQWAGDRISYKGAHSRTQRIRGKASEYSCVDCSKPAVEWSYRGGSARELLDTTQDGKYVIAYSPDAADYDPRCKSDHVRYDANRDRESVPA